MPIRPSLEGSRWQVARINGQPVPDLANYQVEFARGQISGRFGCNRFGGTYRLDPEYVVVGPVAATEMACDAPSMTNEAAGFAALRAPLRIFWTDLGKRLILTSEGGSLDLRRIQ